MRGPLALIAMLGSAEAALADPVIEIVSEAVDGGYSIRAIVRTDAPFTGRASLEIDRQGTAGTARTKQAKTLDLATGEETVVATSRISFSTGDVLDATATLHTPDGQQIDRADLRLDRP